MPYITINILREQTSLFCISHLPSVINVEGETVEVSNDEITAGEKLVGRCLILVGVIWVSILVSM